MMILPCEKRFDRDITIKKQWIQQITFETPYEIDILEKFSDIDDADNKLLGLLKFTNTNIIKVDTNAWTYTVLYKDTENKLPITRLSRGEKLLALCLMAEETKQLIYVSYELTQLSKNSIIKLMTEFEDSKYIILVPPTPTMQHILESINK
jgi:hypothetical protein